MEFDDQISTIRKNIINWYEFKADSKILNLSNGFDFDVSNAKVYSKNSNKEKFDYVVVIGLNSEEEAKEKFDLAQKAIKEDGTIILAFDNKFGIKYFSGVSDDAGLYDSIVSNKLVSLAYMKDLLKQNKFEYKVYYPLPDYKVTNVIYSDERLPDSESIMSRNLICLRDEQYQEFSQRHALIQLLNADKEYFKLFCNSYFIEINKKPIVNDTKYVNFEVYRKEDYNIKTIMKDDFVYKSSNSSLADNHIKNVIKNIELLKKYNIKTLDSYEKNTIKSKMAPKEAISLDKELIRLGKDSKDKAIKLSDRFKKEIIDKLPILDGVPEENIFTKYNIHISEDRMQKLHFVKDGLIDLITQNVFYFDDDFHVYDQEWYEENCPIEFIIYRNIFYNHELGEIISKDEQYEKYGIKEYLKIFLELETNILNSIRNEYIWKKHVEAITKTGNRTINFVELKEKYNKLVQEKSELSMKMDITSYQLQLEKERSEVLENNLRVIEKSLSWKITKPLRYLSWVVNFKNKVSMRDRIFPPGSKTRVKIDKIFPPKNEEALTDYDFWMANNDITKKELEIQKETKFKYEPKISILVPLYNTNEKFFKELLDSLQKQSYSNWELCLADGSNKPLEKIKKLIKNDPRCKYNYLNANKGISENTNEALKLATGDFIGLLDHDDYLTYNCLFEVVKCINKNPDVEFIYTDEDKFNQATEKRCDPHFKPDYAVDTLRCNNYICHFSVFKKELMDKLGGFRSKYDGAQDYDIILRATENTDKICHIPKVLYHWRVHPTSTASTADAKPWAFEAGVIVVQDHLERMGLKGKVTHGDTLGTYQIDYEVIGNPKVTIIIPNKDGIDILDKCLKSILEKTTYLNYEIVIVENNSEDQATFDYYEKIIENDKVNVVYYPEKGFNYSKIINYGVKNSSGDYVIQLNNDTELITPNWLEKMLGFCQREDVGAVGAKLYYPDDTIQHAGLMIGVLQIAAHVFRGLERKKHGYFANDSKIQNLNAVTAACIMTKREIYKQVGYMDETFAVAFNDVDFCLKIRQLNKLIVYNPFVEFYHYESKSRGEDTAPDKRARFVSEVNRFLGRWKEFIDKGDQYYNPNLRLDNDQYAIRTDKVEYKDD